MKNSTIMKMFAQANKKAGYKDYAEYLDNTAKAYEAEEIANSKESER